MAEEVRAVQAQLNKKVVITRVLANIKDRLAQQEM